jgi:cytoskeletal protein CcmA (bactofilin family)
MTVVLAFLALLAVTLVWFLLPLIPALRELMAPSDAEPLTMVGQDAGDLTIFAEGFRNYVRRQLPELTSPGTSPEAVSGALTPAVGQLPDGTPVVHLNGRPEALNAIVSAERLVSHLVVTNSPVALPGGETFLLEIYAREDFQGGPDAVYRALLGEANVHLGIRSAVLRWIHAEGDLSVDDGSILSGRASAANVMRLGANVSFSRVRAERVIIGADEPLIPGNPAPLLTSTMKMPRSARRLRGFIRVDGDLDVPAGESLSGTVVVNGSLRLGAEARIAGSVKVHGAAVLESGAIIDGSLVCRGDIVLRTSARVIGPVIAEGEIQLHDAVVIGAPDHPASVIGATVQCWTNVQIFGSLSARNEGDTRR